MSLTNAQHSANMHTYEEARLRNRHELEERRDKVYAALPRMAALDGEAAALAMKAAEELLSDTAADGIAENPSADLNAALNRIQVERSALLASGGLPEDYLEMTYDCPHCKDTGYIGSRKCRCFIQKECALLYEQSNLQNVFGADSFSTFSLDYYPETPGKNGLPSPREDAAHALRAAQEFVRDFDDPDKPKELCFYGNVGVGKTFLSHCIASELLQKGYSVLYQPSYDLFEKLARYTFSSDTETKENMKEIRDALFSCELLVIDDLGTELTNSFVASALFQIMNERGLLHKATVLSTNIPPDSFADTFSERVSSRLLGSYRLVRLTGTDIRMLKQLERGH